MSCAVQTTAASMAAGSPTSGKRRISRPGSSASSASRQSAMAESLVESRMAMSVLRDRAHPGAPVVAAGGGALRAVRELRVEAEHALGPPEVELLLAGEDQGRGAVEDPVLHPRHDPGRPPPAAD